VNSEIKFLGHKFDSIQAEMNEDTKRAIRDFEIPRNKKRIQAFLGLVNWDRRFIKNLAAMTKPLEMMQGCKIRMDGGSQQSIQLNKKGIRKGA